METLDEGQYHYRGLTFGLGTDYPLVSAVEGLGEFESRTADTALPRAHGNVPGKHYVNGSMLLATFNLGRDTVTDLEDALATLAETFQSSEDDLYPLEWLEHGQPQRLVHCRPVDFKRGYQGHSGKVAQPKVLLTASDPRIYSAEEHTQSIPLYTAGGGSIDYPVNYPKNYPAGVALEAVLTNAGNADAWPTFRVFGPSSGTVTGFTIENRTTGDSVTVTTDILSGQILTFDGTAYVTGNGDLVVSLDGSSRYGSWQQPREPLALIPGDNVLRFTTTGTATSVAAIATWRDTDLS